VQFGIAFARYSPPASLSATSKEVWLPPVRGILHPDAYCMTRTSNDKDAAWRFMESALGPEFRTGP
jgi:hypothetical protein